MYKYLLILCAMCACHASDSDIEARYKMDLNKIDTIRLYPLTPKQRLILQAGNYMVIHDNVIMVRKGKRIVMEYHDSKDSVYYERNF